MLVTTRTRTCMSCFQTPDAIQRKLPESQTKSTLLAVRLNYYSSIYQAGSEWLKIQNIALGNGCKK